MSSMIFICTTPEEKLDDIMSLKRYMEDMGYEVAIGRNCCSPQGQQAIKEKLDGEDQVVLVCSRRLEREVFENILPSDKEFFSYRLEEDPRELANTIHTEITLTSHEKVIDLKPLESVLVIGGGVGGVFAALDIAEQGYPVYMVERDPSIGGIMAALDKTFPTMDCSI